MSDSKSSDRPSDREERLAARLRENLRRRKAQARAIAGDSPDGADEDVEPDPKAGLSKTRTDR